MQHKLTSLGRKGHKTVLFVGQGPVKSELKQRCICLRKLSLIVTALAALMAGAALFAIAARGIWASVSHALTGNAGNALLVGLIAVACFLAALAFLVPGWFRRIIRTGEQRRYRMPVTFGASVVLLVIAFGAAVTDRASGDQISGLVPHKALLPATLAFAALFCLAFIVPGLAYRMNPDGKASLPDASRAPRPAPKLAWSVDNLGSPGLRRAVQASGLVYVALAGLAFYAWAFASVLPDPAIVEANRRFISLSILLPTLVIGLPLWRAPITGGAGGRLDHFKAKGPALLGLLMFNGLMAVNLPERALPILASWVMPGHVDSRAVTVVAAKPRSGQRGCGAKIVILLNPATGRQYDLCHMPHDVARKARPGDGLILHGTSAGFGLVLERATLIPQPDDSAQLPSRQRLTIG